MKKIILSVLSLVLIIPVYAAAPTRSFDYTAGTTINPTHVTTNEDNMFTYLQAGVEVVATDSVESGDIQDSAITTSKILDGTIANADISGTAAIADTKLATISTADKVNTDALTTTTGVVGQLLYHTGTKWDAIGPGTNGQALVTRGAGSAPFWYSLTADQIVGQLADSNMPGMQVATGTTTKNLGAAGTTTISGLGFKPEAVIFFTAVTNASRGSWGLDNGSNANCVFGNYGGGADSLHYSSSNSIYNDSGGGNTVYGSITTMGVDGFTITWTRNGAAAGTLNICYMAMR